MSPDNVMLHFPPNSQDKVYIGICDWAMAGNFNDLKESLYIHESQEVRTRIMEHRWWVTPKLNDVLPPLGNTSNGDPSSLQRMKHMQWAKLPSGSMVATSPLSTTKKREEMTHSASQQWIKSFNIVWSNYIKTTQSNEPP
jgi:hypothetical protein